MKRYESDYFKPGVQRRPNRVLQILVVLSAGGLLSLNWIGHRKPEAKYLWFACS